MLNNVLTAPPPTVELQMDALMQCNLSRAVIVPPQHMYAGYFFEE